MFTHLAKNRYISPIFASVLLILILLGLAACGGEVSTTTPLAATLTVSGPTVTGSSTTGAPVSTTTVVPNAVTSTPSPGEATTTPTVQITPTDTVSPTDTPTPPTNTPTPTQTFPNAPVLALPVKDAEQLAKLAGVLTSALAVSRTAIYALPDTGIAYMLTPPTQFPAGTGKFLGGLTVIQPLTVTVSAGQISILPSGHYAMMTNGEQVALRSDVVSGGVPPFLPAIVRAGDPSVTRSTALITAQQMCIGETQQQICISVNIPLPLRFQNQMQAALDHLHISPVDLNLEMAVPDIEGQEAVELCAQDLNAGQYADCRASVLAASAVNNKTFPPVSVNITGTGIGLLVALQDLKDAFYTEPDLGSGSNKGLLLKDDYLVYEARTTKSQPLANGIVPARLALRDSKGNLLYAPAYTNLHPIGSTQQANAPKASEETIILAIVYDVPIVDYWACWDSWWKTECQAWIAQGQPHP